MNIGDINIVQNDFILMKPGHKTSLCIWITDITIIFGSFPDFLNVKKSTVRIVTLARPLNHKGFYCPVRKSRHEMCVTRITPA